MDDPKNLWEIACKITNIENINLSETRSYSVKNDLKHLLFTLSRYKFASKLVAHEKKLSLLELGCLDGLGINIFKQTNVIEHISVSEEREFLETIAKNLSDTGGIAVIGTPNMTFFPYAAAGSKIAHINNFDQQRLHDLCKTQFNNVFIFGMNDEVLHTGFDQFCCYIFAVCCNKKICRYLGRR